MTQVLLETTLGNITIELNQELAPKTTANFLEYVNQGYYTGLIFHRVIKGFMIQAGGYDAEFNEAEKNLDPITNEANNGLKNVRGSVAMARTQDPHSASAQFFINHKDNAFLDFTSETVQGWGYAVFAMIVGDESFETLDKIAAVPTGRKNYHSDVPKEDVVITSCKVL